MAALLEPSTPETGFRSELGATVRLALPLILGGFAQMAINTVDVLILGRYDVAALAASALALNLLWAMAIFGIGVVTAASPLIAAERGRRPHSVREVRRTVRQAWWASAFLCVPIWLVAWHAEAVFLLLGQEPALASAAAAVLGHLPGRLLTSDQVRLLRTDNVVSEAAVREKRTLAALGIEPATIAAIVPSYLYRYRARGQFDRQRTA